MKLWPRVTAGRLRRLATLAGNVSRNAGLAEARCLSCRTMLRADAGSLCPACERELAPRRGGYCPSCGRLYEREAEPPHLCRDCREEPMPWSRLHFHGGHEGRLRELLLAFKFEGSFAHAGLLQELLARAYAPELPAELIAPVPLHFRRLLRRGFNQSLELSRLLCRISGIPLVPTALRRIRRTRPQTTLDKAQRQQNIEGAFRADEMLVAGKRVLLVDDVLTTGATLRECVRTLRAGGATDVEVLVLTKA